MGDQEKTRNLEEGSAIIREYAEMLSSGPGVYRMLDKNRDVLYVGKAKSLKKRVASYTHVSKLSVRLQRMVASTCEMEFVQTHTEAEALLLESNLIKKLKPRFNILLRDDKSFPYIFLTQEQDFPMVAKHRGAKKRKGDYYGPYASAGDVNRTITILQRVFMLRNCSDHVFENRSRPCLQYHIKRCTAPCVNKVTKAEYEQQVAQARSFLDGNSRALQNLFSEKMHEASADMDYERAASYRDRIKILTSIQSHQGIHLPGLESVDVVAMVREKARACVQVFFFRGGGHNGSRSYFPRHDEQDTEEDILSAFLAQFYENKPIPKQIIVSHAVMQRELLEEAFSQKAGERIKIYKPERGKRKEAMEFARVNARAALQRHLVQKMGEEKRLRAVADLFEMQDIPQRIEVYDNSHTAGTNMVGAMIVAGPEGFQKSAYRKFNIKSARMSDDYGMMQEVFSRRFKNILKSDGGESVRAKADVWPDLVLVDGGKGQLSVVQGVLEEMGALGMFKLVAIAKGEERNAGRETFFVPGRSPFTLPEGDPVLHYLQGLRDEAHRFVIGAHRAKRSKQIQQSPLDNIPGVGAKRKKALLLYFGSGKAVSQAGISDLEKVEGVSGVLAEVIYNWFH